MAGFYGLRTVLADLRKHRRTGKVVSATLTRGPAFTTTQAYANAYVAPVGGTSGLGGDGYPSQTTTAYLWQLGETYVPRPDDRLAVGGNTWLVVAVTTRLNADTGYAVHDCTVTDKL
jgi:hypothetical protein